MHTPDRCRLFASSTVLYLNRFWTSGWFACICDLAALEGMGRRAVDISRCRHVWVVCCDREKALRSMRDGANARDILGKRFFGGSHSVQLSMGWFGSAGELGNLSSPVAGNKIN
jgi:hypothetical protein